MVTQAINYFILSTSNPAKSKLENLTMALRELTSTRQETTKNSESLILRDTQRYFYGVLGDYLFSNQKDVGILYKPEKDPGINQAEYSSKSGEKTVAGRLLAEFADTAYNSEKEFLVIIGKEEWQRTVPNRPVSAVGGSSWYDFGRLSHYDKGTDLNIKGMPKLVSPDDLSRFDEQLRALRDINLSFMHTIMTTTY